MSESSQDVLFLQLVAMFQFAAMQQMGKMANPVTGEMERNLQQARVSIDMLQMLQKKTEGRRSREESEFLDKILFELQMNYVDEVKRGDQGEQGEHAEGGPGAAPDEEK